MTVKNKVIRRKQGAQPGNLNAFRHGFYSSLFEPMSDKQRRQMLSTNLDDEITMLRTATMWLFQLAQNVEDLDQAIKALGALGLASIRTCRLLKYQQDLGNGDQALSALRTAINEVLKGKGWS